MFEKLLNTVKNLFKSPVKKSSENISYINTEGNRGFQKILKERLSLKPLVTDSGFELSRKQIKELRKLEKQWNKVHSKFWKDIKNSPLVAGGKNQAETLAQRGDITDRRINTFMKPNFIRETDLSKIRNQSDYDRRMEIMRYEISPVYMENRTRDFRKNIENNINFYGDEDLANLFNSLNDRQLQYLQNQTIFQETFYQLIPSDPNKLTLYQKQEIMTRIENMKKEITRALQM